jgi:glyoxylase-like metal-dependent hydrolase (beta-lactamase superfamily II)
LRAIALHRDVLVATSAIWQTNCVVVRSGEEAFVVDSPVLPAELEALPTLLEQAGFPSPSGLLATHGDWDHLLGRIAFPGLALGCAESTAARMRAAPGETQRELRGFDEGLAIQRPRPLALGAVQALPVPGRCAIGERELELHPTAGHTEDGFALWASWARVLVVGDYLSPIELPSLDARRSAAREAGSRIPSQADPLGDYRATLELLRPIVQSAEHVVPGHGAVLDAEHALVVIAEDLAYLKALRDGQEGAAVELPVGRSGPLQRERHAQNVQRLLAAGADHPL